MNIKQLEKVMDLVCEIRKVLREDESGIYPIKQKLDALEEQVQEELKNLLWEKYLEDKNW